MADVRPFRALRFTEKAGELRELTCPPYDIIDESQRLSYLKRNPHNIIRLELPRDGADPYDEAGNTLRQWVQEGILRRDDQPAFYIYEIEYTLEGRSDISGYDGGRRTIAGLIGQVKLEEFSKGVVLPHEETLSKAKEDRLRLMKATACNFSDVYSLYRDDGGESEALDILTLIQREQPEAEFTDGEGLIHRLWAVSDPSLTAAISRRFADKKLYIADGHHRYETALNYRNWLREQGKSTDNADYIMMMLVEMGHPGLAVFPTHRLLRGLPDFDADALLAECGGCFDVLPEVAVDSLDESLEEAYNAGRHAFGFYTGGDTFTLLTLREGAAAGLLEQLLPDKSPVYRRLDVSILHTLILERLLGIDKANMAGQRNLSYTRSLQEALDDVAAGVYQCSFLLNPTRVDEIRDVAAAGEKMPQKSTYFYPKLITGLTINPLD